MADTDQHLADTLNRKMDKQVTKVFFLSKDCRSGKWLEETKHNSSRQNRKYPYLALERRNWQASCRQGILSMKNVGATIQG